VVKRSDLFFITLLLFTFSTGKLFAQVNIADTSRVRLDEVTITATRIPIKAGRLSRLAIVIPQNIISESPSRDLPDVLKSVPIVDIRSRGPFSVQSDLSIRGGSFEQSAVLLNGINLNDPQTGHFLLDLPVPLNMIGQLEILPGSDARSMGAGALAGAVNLVTSRPGKTAIHGEISAGRWGLKNLELSGRSSSKNFWHQEALSLQGSEGYRENTDFKKYGGFFQAGWSKGPYEADITAGILLKSFGANSFYSVKYPDQFEETASGLSILNLTRTGRINVRETMFYRSHFDIFHLFRNEAPSWYLSPNYHISQVAGSKTDAWFKTSVGITSFGAEIRHESISSTVLGTPSAKPVRYPFSDSITLDKGGVRNHYSFIAQHNIERSGFTLSGSMVFHLAEGSKTHLNLYPGLEAGLNLPKGFSVFGSVNRGFRLPSFTELYYKSPTNLGNPGLMPESAWHAETGLKFRAHRVEGTLAGFYRYAKQSIDWVRMPEEEIWHAENLGKISTYGIEGFVRFSGNTADNRSFSFDQAFLGFKYCFQRHTAEAYYSLYILDYLKWKVNSSLTVSYRNTLTLTIQGILQDRAGTYSSFSMDGSVKEEEFNPYFLLDARISYRYKALILFADCSNLLNQTYFDFGNIPQPGLWYRAGVMLDLAWR